MQSRAPHWATWATVFLPLLCALLFLNHPQNSRKNPALNESLTIYTYTHSHIMFTSFANYSLTEQCRIRNFLAAERRRFRRRLRFWRKIFSPSIEYLSSSALEGTGSRFDLARKSLGSMQCRVIVIHILRWTWTSIWSL